MKQSNIFKPTLKFMEKTSVSNTICIRGKIRLDSCKNRYYTNNTQSHIHLQNNHIKCALHTVLIHSASEDIKL